MTSRILSSREIDAIEERYKAGKLKEDDVGRLLFTVRRLRESLAPGKPCDDSSRQAASCRSVPKESPGGERMKVEVFTDGACRGNPGPGGWGAVVRKGGRETELSGGEPHTTNNRMEMTAVIEALETLPGSCEVILTTDSQYVQKGITQWIRNWKRNGWKNAAKEPVKNADLWMKLDELNRTHDIEWRWVRGHAGHRENERCDELAREEILKRSRS